MRCTVPERSRMISFYVGGSDRRLSRFENLFPIPKGYPITAMCCWMRKPCCLTRRTSPSAVSISKRRSRAERPSAGYMVVQHMEPDHCAMIDDMLRRYPEAKMVCSAKAVGMYAQFYGTDVAARALVVKGRRQAAPRASIPAFCHGTDGALAGSYGFL